MSVERMSHGFLRLADPVLDRVLVQHEQASAVEASRDPVVVETPEASPVAGGGVVVVVRQGAEDAADTQPRVASRSARISATGAVSANVVTWLPGCARSATA